MATSRSEIMSDEIIGIKCCFCAADNRTREAETYCVDCKDYYCSPCTETHKKVSVTKGHTLLDKVNFKSQGSDDSLQSIPTQRCSQHPTEVINMFCKDHNEVACAPCIAFTHRTCTKIHFIPDEVDNLYQRTELANMKHKIDTTKKNTQEVKTAKEKRVKELQEAFEKEVESVKSFAQELQTLLDNVEKETIRELKQEFDRIESSLTSEIHKANNLLDDLNDVLALLKKSEGNKSQEFVSIKSAEKVTAKAKNVEKELLGKTVETISFDANENIKSFLQQIQSFGKVSSKQFISNEENSADNVNDSGQAEVKHEDVSSYSINGRDSLYKVTRSKEIDVKLTNDSSVCSISGSCISEEGDLLLSDYNNKKLKRLDMSTEEVKDYIDLSAGPIAVCLISKTEAAVTMYNSSLQFVSLGNKLSATRMLTMSHGSFGLAHKDGKLFISDSRNTVYIHDMNGQELKKISTDASQKQIFLINRHVTVSPGEDKVFVADANKGLVILDIQGNYLSTLTYPTVSSTIGVCTDGKNLFVCGWSSKNIVQIGHDNKLLGELGKVTSCPYSVCFDPHKTRLIVTQYNNNQIKVLELE